MSNTFDSWFDREYPQGEDGRRPRYQDSLVITLMQDAWKAGAKAMQERCVTVCETRFMGDNNREDMEALRCAAAIEELEPNE